jgi:peptide/nickel transport system ATP-binding protein
MSEAREALLSVKSHSVFFRMYDRGFKYRDSQVINKLSIDVMPGEIAAIVGASGAGKSVLAHSILGLLPDNARTEGEIWYDGTKLTQVDKERLRGIEIALIPQSVNYLDPLMKVGGQVVIPRKGDGGGKVRTQMTEVLFARYGLAKEVMDYYPFQLSGGMTRRVLVCAAFSCGARLVIADEPTPGMDRQAVEETVSLFRSLAKEGCGVMLITHDIDMALRVADKVSVFLDGTVIETAGIEAFSGKGERLRHPFSRALYNALPQNGFHSSQKETALI